MVPRALLPSLVLGFSLLAAGSARAALFHADTSVYDGSEQIDDDEWAASTQDELDNQFGAVPGEVAGAHSELGLFEATAVAQPLSLHVLSRGQWDADDWLQVAPFASGTASLSDEFMLIDPTGMATAASRAFFAVELSGLVIEDQASVFFTLGAGICPTGYGCLDLNVEGSWFDGVHEGGDLNLRYLSTEGVLPFNTPISITWSLAVGGGPALRSSGSFVANLQESATWGGIVLLDEEGVPIEGIQLVSPSDINWLEAYAPPVPEPGAAGLVGAALAWLVARRRRA